jgi:parallel beta-helix repeat protein
MMAIVRNGVLLTLLGVVQLGCSSDGAANRPATTNTDAGVDSEASAGGAAGTGTGGASGASGNGGGVQGCVPMPTSATVVNVKDTGAKGDGVTDDTASIQAAVDQVAGSGATVLVPDGVYMIDAEKSVILKSKMTFHMSTGATLRALPNSATNYHVIYISSASEVYVVGGTIEGERGAHTGTTGEWGHGLVVSSSQNVAVDTVTSKECWGDGFYVGGASSANVTFCNVVAAHNRRQGMSVSNVNGLIVRDSRFENTIGTEPESGLDVEPNEGETVTNTLIAGCTFTNNAGGGLQIGPANVNKLNTFVTKLVAEKNKFIGNGVGGISPPNYGIRLSSCTGNTIRDNLLQDNSGVGIGVLDTNDAVVTGNTVTGTKVLGSGSEAGAGIILENDVGTTCTNNTVTGNEGYEIFTWQSDCECTPVT